MLLGNSGTGKSHLLIGACLAAAENGLRVRYITCAELANELAEANDDHKLSRVVARYGRYDLLAIDELGYVRLDQHSAELLFQILTEREERAAVAVASNAPFSEWSKTFTDPRLAAAEELNARPRKILGWATPADLFASLAKQAALQ